MRKNKKMRKANDMTITVEDQLKAMRKVSRETNVSIRPTVVRDKKKDKNKKSCRKFRY